MPRFFISPEKINGESILLEDEDAHHAIRVLRLREGEAVTVCDGQGTEYLCTVSGRGDNALFLRILSHGRSTAEPWLGVTLFQALPKGDKLDEIVQKAVELGVLAVVPFISARSIVRTDRDSFERKRERLARIALEAAKQSGRGIVPTVAPLMSFDEAAHRLEELERSVMLYEMAGGVSLKSSLEPGGFSTFGFMIGPEGGFEYDEVLKAQNCGIELVHLGERILRTETASACVLSAVMYATGNL